MVKDKMRSILAVIALIASMGLLIWSLVPQGRERRVVPIPASEMQIPTTDETSLYTAKIPSPQIVNLESRTLVLELPMKIRVGDTELIRLRLDVDEQGNIVPTDEQGGELADSDNDHLIDIFTKYNIIAEARLELAGMKITPAETISEPLLPKQQATFYWSLRPIKEGNYRGTIWLYIRFIPNNGGIESRRVISVQFLEVEAITLFGIGVGQARAMGASGLLTGILLGIPFIENRVRRSWRKVSEQG